jgi:DNA-binding transcriptional regulator YiaG
MNAVDLAVLRQMCLSGEARRIRQQAKLSLGDIAAEVGASAPPTVQRWETGQRMPRGYQATKYLRVLRRLEALGERSPARDSAE